uniref:Uncharacterized protein n=1 Tax=Rhizophora mucronata TaxID=61149 RepID=A0A2P2MMZ5_RHIMU
MDFKTNISVSNSSELKTKKKEVIRNKQTMLECRGRR